MFDELTEIDIKKMKEELEYRITKLRPEILEEVKLTRSYGDLSENAEYHAAKRERGKNESRIRFLRNMIKTAVIIKDESTTDTVGLFDTVTYYMEEDECEEQVKIVTTLRRDPFQNIISKESPLGSTLMGKKVGDRVSVKVSDDYSYFIEIRKIEKGKDDDSLEIRKF
ncbi:MAG: transcription elongation factor GreA [Ruminococcaceae bacterium]|nr:transcription elongation factor GreA [Oscillospiraceae bacterium]